MGRLARLISTVLLLCGLGIATAVHAEPVGQVADRDCTDFSAWQEAQSFFLAADVKKALADWKAKAK